MSVPVIIADGQKMMREGLTSLLASSGRFRLVAEAASGLEAIQLWRTLQPRLGVFALRLPGINGVEATRAILRFDPSARIILLAADDDPPLLHLADSCGACSVLSRFSDQSDLFSALESALAARPSSPPHPNPALPAPPRPVAVLSPRELQVLRLVAEGKSSKEIAQALNLEVETVRTYRKTMMRKMHVTNAAEVTRAAVLAGLLPPNSPTASPD